MRNKWKPLILAGVLSLSLSAPAYAGSWQLDAAGYWYQNDDGSYPANGWQWIDGNHDGIAESYYFNDKGYILASTTTPDGYAVDANGAWIVNGVVQTQAVAVPSAPAQAPKQEAPAAPKSGTGVSSTGIASAPYNGYDIIVNTSTKKYHYPSCKSVKDIKAKNMGYSDHSVNLDALGYVPCQNCH